MGLDVDETTAWWGPGLNELSSQRVNSRESGEIAGRGQQREASALVLSPHAVENADDESSLPFDPIRERTRASNKRNP